MQKKRGKKQTSRTARRVIKKPSLFARSLKFLPAILIFSAAYSIHSVPVTGTSKNLTNSSVLSYATSMSNGELLSQTNAQRSQNGVAGLNLNSQLNAAAQSKANDMVARDYWAHVTPTGEQPWAFMSAAGYAYRTAGENLAYGFGNAADTVTGWMNSPPHRENLLNGSFQDVGFGYANSANFVGNGQQTIIVAMYGAPSSQPAAAAASQPSTPAAAAPQTKPSATAAAPTPAAEVIQTSPEAVAEVAKAEPASENTEALAEETVAAPVASAVKVRRIQLITGGNARWSSTLLVLSICGMGILWTLQRSREIRRLMRAGERFFLHHIHLDLTIASFITLGLTLLQTTGNIR